MAEHSPELNELAAALSAAQAEFVAIPKDSTNPFFKSKYAGLPQVVAVASPILTKHGLSVSQHIGHDEGGDTLTTWLLHRSGQFISESMRLHSAPQKGLTEVQAQGSATTYSRRYAYMAVLGLVADEDDDGAGARQSNGGQRQAPIADAPKPTTRPASAAQRGMINARASEADLAPSEFANVILAAAGQSGRDFDSEEHARQFVNRQLERLPAQKVDAVLVEIKKTQEQAA